MVSGIRITVVAITFCCLPVAVHGQGAFLKDGQSGFGFSGGYGSSRSVDATAFTLGYSADGRFDFGVGTANVVGQYGSERQFNGSLTIYPLRQDSAGNGISAAVDVSLHLTEAGGVAYAYEVAIFHRFALGNEVFLQPLLGVTHVDPKTSGGQSETAEIIGVSFISKLDELVTFVMTPAMSVRIDYGETVGIDNWAYSITAGLIIHSSGKKKDSGRLILDF